MLQACHLQQTGKLMELLDENLDSEVNKREAETMIKVALLCTNASASVRPTMSEVVSMLEGQIAVPEIIPEKSSYSEDLRFKAMRDLRKEQKSQNSSKNETQTSTTGYHFPSFTSTQEFLEIKSESFPEIKHGTPNMETQITVVYFRSVVLRLRHLQIGIVCCWYALCSLLVLVLLELRSTITWI